ncbi:MAG: hypothetical protein IPP13_21470 [Kouleothrix sp.]|nr:hypothetical protein [Kouleothrix sp.]
MALHRSISATNPERVPARTLPEAPAGAAIAAPLLPLSDEVAKTLEHLFQQLSQSLSVLNSLSSFVTTGKASAPTGQSLQGWLQPNARIAEAAMHQLRDMRLIKSPLLTSLSQNLTVLVLATDMLSQGHAAGSDALAFYDLLQRNADSAIGALYELRAQLGIAAP